jgi:putative Mg2+ transporter-C (MgtC) family protein
MDLTLASTNDMTRIAVQVVTGVGFLCSGIILKEGLNIKGLNTASTIWFTAAIDVLYSTEHIAFATIGAFSLFVCNLVFQFADVIQPFIRHERDNKSRLEIGVIPFRIQKTLDKLVRKC